MISGAKISSKFYVLDSLHHSLILGINFLECHDAYLHLQASTLFLKDKTLCASLIGNKAGLARLEKYTTIPAHCEVEIPVKVSKRKKGEIVLLEPVNYLQSQGIGGAKCLVKVHKSKTVFRVINPTDTDIELSANRVVASVHEIHSDHIHELGGSQSASNSANVNSATTNQSSTSDEINFNISNENLS